ncbi:MAG: T9SS type A sorting domain-containing protein [Saprospiraceae bacterium]|nr:T9SS type A sorting domain-containing protein [Saprospiraceae bacterium]
MEVFNILQQRVAEYKMISLEGSNNYSFKIDHLIAGTYFCKITSGSQVYIQKMIKS